MSLIRSGLFGLLFLLPLLARAVESAPAKSEHTVATLVAEPRALRLGDTFPVALRLRMDPSWHTYWINPGDAGIATRIDWTLPPGLKAGEIEWPAPRLLPVPPLMDYGYEGEVWLLTEMKVTGPLTWPLKIGASAKWLECAEICIPGKADLTLTLPAPQAAKAGTKPAARGPLQAAWDAVPKLLPATATITPDGPDAYRVEVTGEAPDFPVRFLPVERGWIDNPSPQLSVRTGQGMTIRVKRDPNAPALVDGATFPGVLVGLPPGASAPKGWLVDARVVAPAAPPAPPPRFPWSVLFFAFVGGLILNLMPCVLPVLALKVLALAGHQGERKASRRSGIEFTLGVLVSFWVLAGLLLAFRAAGEKLGWGFQLQSPSFVVLVAALFVLIALNLFGLFEVGGRLMGWGGGLASKGAGRLAFGSGVLAVVVATPCTAPFMGAALAVAFAQPAWVALLVFTFLGLGLAAPYLILAANPAWLRFVPKPGAWMVTFRQLLGFPMIAAALWLAWVYGNQRGLDAAGLLLAALLLVALGGWIYGKWDAPDRSPAVRALAGLAAVLLIGGSLTFVLSRTASLPRAAQADADAFWKPYDAAQVAALRAQGKPVFIDFTAAWCLSCQVNERVALDRPEVKAKFREKGIAVFKADWTSSDPAVTAALAALGRQSVPVYALYLPGADAPRLLPELLTPGIVLRELDAVPNP